MTQKAVIYCRANFTHSEGGDPLSIALVLPNGRWRYAEIIDFDPAACDVLARTTYLPLLRRIPGTRFIKTANLSCLINEFIDAMLPSSEAEVEIRVSNTSPAMHRIASQVSELNRRSISWKNVVVNQESFVDFLRHCGGVEKTEGHALLHAVASALCDVERDTPTSFHEASIFHLELLLGSKNATSYRAWARALERHWDSLQQAAA